MTLKDKYFIGVVIITILFGLFVNSTLASVFLLGALIAPLLIRPLGDYLDCICLWDEFKK